MSNADADDTNPNGSGDDAGRTLSQAPSQDEADVVRRTLSDVSPSYLGGAYGRTDVDPGPAAPPPPSRLRAAHNRNAEYSTPHPQVRYTGQLGGSPPAAYHEPRAAYAADSGPPQLPLRAFPEADPSKPMLGGGRSPTPASCMSASYVSVDDAKVAQQVMDIKKSALLRLSLASARAGRSYGAAAAASEYPYAAPGAGHSTPFESASSRGSERREPSQRAQAPPLRAAPSEAHAAYLRSLPRRPAPTQASGAFTHRVSDVQPSAGTAWPPPPPQVQQPTKPAGLWIRHGCYAFSLGCPPAPCSSISIHHTTSPVPPQGCTSPPRR
eukprot:TRINITY_DN8284_c0_g1_i1.p1 TRINITY_DN8284_c0_g1~~TRINITY_DN8284_c0_g1_i1.p1  ORF type:complete len:325 (+),score=38.86 TRINITY_DN8284_c0_g1_i1:168-1142(+)